MSAIPADLAEWASARDLRRSSTKHPCLHWVSKGRCAVSNCRENRNRHAWMDHVTGWLRDGKPVLVCEPYQITGDDFTDLARSADRFGLSVMIHANSGYGYGALCVELTGRERHD